MVIINFLVLLLPFSLPALSMAIRKRPPVQPSEYASIGKIGQYVGHLNDFAGLKAAMAACSYKNEIILVVTSSKFVDAAAQTIDMFK